MSDNRRKPEASAIRRLFHDQWNYFLQLMQERDQRQQSETQKSTALTDAIEIFVSGTDARMRAIGGYKKRLRDGVNSILAHVEALVSGLPPAIIFNQKGFANDPLVNSLFVSVDDLHQIFSRCQPLQAFFNNPGHSQLEEVYALLLVQKKQKTILGKHLQGELILSDVIQTSVCFTDHQVLTPEASESQLRKSLETLLFNSIVEYTKTHMTRMLHQQLQDNPQQKALSLDKSIKNPEVYLQTLIAHLNQPGQLLQQQESLLKLSKMGILLSDDDSSRANDLRLNMLTIGDFPSSVIALARYPRSELLPAKKIADWK